MALEKRGSTLLHRFTWKSKAKERHL
ncbi:hypothetical protein P5673_025656 [Acropora cervicornis]|uniref:Uncharacterized protein n=1 Tax=Acropora cervicornis TaxID=6130 RepID=A0AAD9Q269_ACRCE|nr:hypothetical protein P5673_025656 [Acropora cervicornis]